MTSRIDSTTTAHRVTDVTCLACGCLCDDIAVHVDPQRSLALEVENACEIGRNWFGRERSETTASRALIDGQPAALEAALEAATRLLISARAPLITGLGFASLQAQRIAVGLADHLMACIDSLDSEAHSADLAARQSLGAVTASFGEVQARADTIVFWHVDPVRTHPRLWERWIDPPGRFVTDGRSGRQVIVVATEPSTTSELADLSLFAPHHESVLLLHQTRGLLSGLLPPSPNQPAGLSQIAEILKASRYLAWFYNPATWSRRSEAEAFHRLVGQLNTSARAVAIPLGLEGNPAGFTTTLTWQAGAPSSVDFSSGHPDHLPSDASAGHRLKSRESDLVLLIGDDPNRLANHVAGVPRITIGPVAPTELSKQGVYLPTGWPGLESDGTVVRSDGVTLPLRPPFASALPSDHDVLARLLAQVKQQLAAASTGEVQS